MVCHWRLKSLFFVFVPLVLLIPASAKSASNSDDAKFISQVIANVVSAWNENNIEAIARVFLSDGILITPRGSVIRTRSEIRKRISSERQGKLKDTVLTHSITKMSVQDNGTAVVEGIYELKGMKILAIEISPRGSFIAHHRKQEGRWMISKAEFLKKKDE
jgi:uncharacterized protein (TIGR02246 family)